MADIKPGDEERESMLNGQTNEVKIVDKTVGTKKKGLDDASALEDFLRSISSTATLPGYIKGNNYSSVRGIVNQALVTCCVLVLSAAAGHPIGYSAVLLPQLREENGTLFTDVEMGSWIASIHSAATPLGSAVSGPMMDYLGRRRALQLAMLPLLAGWALLATAGGHAQILAGRIVCGLAVGAVAATSQVYLGEISEPRLRGMLIGTPFVAYSMGVLYVYVVGGATHWRATAWLSMVLPLASIAALALAPESPTWLARNGKLKAAALAIGRLRGDDATAERELHQIISASEKERLNTSNASFLETILKMPVLKPLILINVFNTLQILCGTYVIIFYAVDIISETAQNVPIDISISAILTGVVRLIFTIIACFLLLAIGRRTLAIFSGAVSAVSILILSILMYFKAGTPQSTFDSYLNGACLMVYIASNTLGFMVLPGLMIGELLPARVRGMCGGYIFMIFNAMLFGFTKIYPTMKQGWGMYGMFFMFGISSVVGTLFVYLMLPETKGKSLIEVEQYFQKPNFFWVTRDKNNTSSSNV